MKGRGRGGLLIYSILMPISFFSFELGLAFIGANLWIFAALGFRLEGVNRQTGKVKMIASLGFPRG